MIALTTGAIVGIVCGFIVGVFYLFVCYVSIRKAISDRRTIIERNEARKNAREKAKQFSQTFSKPPNLFKDVNNSKSGQLIYKDSQKVPPANEIVGNNSAANIDPLEVKELNGSKFIQPVAIGDVEPKDFVSTNGKFRRDGSSVASSATATVETGGGGGGQNGGGAGSLKRGSQRGSTRRRNSYEKAVDKIPVSGTTPSVNDQRQQASAKESLNETTPRMAHMAEFTNCFINTSAVAIKEASI